MTPFLDEALIPNDYLVPHSVSKWNMPDIHNMVCNEASYTQWFHSVMFDGEHAVEEM